MSGIRSSAHRGYAPAQNNLGAMYDRGQGVSQDYKQAFEWYQKSAHRGYAPAQYNVGQMYHHGLGVPKNLIYAYSWFNLALSNGKKMAKKPINDLSGIMSPEQIAKAKKHSAQIAQEINENKKLQNDSLDSIAN